MVSCRGYGSFCYPRYLLVKVKTRVHLFISGRVQGVFFRATTRDKARELGVKGWVKNLPDGKVEVMAEGEKERIDELIEWCRAGPGYAKVSDVEVMDEKYREEFTDFEIRC